MNRRLLFIAIIGVMITGCGKTVSVEDVDQGTETIEEAATVEDTVPEVIEEPNEDYATDWGQAYLDHLQNFEEMDDSSREAFLNDCKYTLIYVDDDDTPELLIDTCSGAGGEFMFTYYDGEVTDYHFRRYGTTYIPRTGMIFTDTGHMDYYPVYVTKLENGVFTQLMEGLYYMTDDAMKTIQETGYYDESLFTYEVEGVEVSKEAFDSEIAKYIDKDQLVLPDDYYSYSEMKEMLKSGNMH